MDLNELIDKTHFDYEQNEVKAKQLEERILKVPGMSKSYLPKRQYGQQFKGDPRLPVKEDKKSSDSPKPVEVNCDSAVWKNKPKCKK